MKRSGLLKEDDEGSEFYRESPMRVQIGVAAYSGDPPLRLIEEAKRFVNALPRECSSYDIVLVLGGYRGLMKVVVDEALRRGLKVMLVLPRDYEGIDEPPGAFVVRTGMDVRGRSVILVRSSDVLVVLGGGSGTLMEAITAYSIGKPVVYLKSSGLWSDRFADAYPGGEVDPRFGRLITYVESGEEAAKEACRVVKGR